MFLALIPLIVILPYLMVGRMLVKLLIGIIYVTEYSDLFEAPGFPVECQIKYHIDLLNPNLLVKHHRQYCICHLLNLKRFIHN